MGKFDSSQSLWFVCKYCKRAFSLAKDLISHKRKIHSQQFLRDKKEKRQVNSSHEHQNQNLLVEGTQAVTEKKKLKSNSEITTDLKRRNYALKLECNYCEKICTTKIEWISHQKTHISSQIPRSSGSPKISTQVAQVVTCVHHNKNTNITSTNDASCNFEYRVDNRKSKTLTKALCTICKKNFYSKHAFENHGCDRSLKDSNEFQCSKCFARFRWASAFQVHELREHAFKCEFCPRSFIFAASLDDHDSKHHKIAQVQIQRLDLNQLGLCNEFGKKNSESKLIEKEIKVDEDDDDDMQQTQHPQTLNLENFNYHDCTSCEEVFSSEEYRQLHEKLVHLNSFSNSCDSGSFADIGDNNSQSNEHKTGIFQKKSFYKTRRSTRETV